MQWKVHLSDFLSVGERGVHACVLPRPAIANNNKFHPGPGTIKKEYLLFDFLAAADGLGLSTVAYMQSRNSMLPK